MVRIVLSPSERETLERHTRRATTAQALALRARIVLRCAAGSVSDIRSGNWFVAARMTLTSGKDHRTFRLPRAADALQPNDRVVVMYRQYKSTLTAKVIRTIPHSGVPVAAGF